ncbi:hypothetical protein KKD49_18995, partial [Myxococcota bacterium]|nr:hypothetical protein [Myxococcota bacterium]
MLNLLLARIFNKILREANMPLSPFLAPTQAAQGRGKGRTGTLNPELKHWANYRRSCERGKSDVLLS